MLAACTRLTLYQLNGTAINFGPVTNGITGAIVSDAAGTFNLYDSTGTLVPGASGISFTYTSGGVYQAVINGSLFDPPEGEAYYYVISLTSGSAGAGSWSNPVSVLTRMN